MLVNFIDSCSFPHNYKGNSKKKDIPFTMFQHWISPEQTALLWGPILTWFFFHEDQWDRAMMECFPVRHSALFLCRHLPTAAFKTWAGLFYADLDFTASFLGLCICFVHWTSEVILNSYTYASIKSYLEQRWQQQHIISCLLHKDTQCLFHLSKA